jgi:hypothetical protein
LASSGVVTASPRSRRERSRPIADIRTLRDRGEVWKLPSFPMLISALTSCAPNAPASLPQHGGGPSERDFLFAMDASLQTDERVFWVHCHRFSRLRCARIDGDTRRFQCTYRFEDGTRGSAVVEEPGDDQLWRWISGGPRQCSVMIMPID